MAGGCSEVMAREDQAPKLPLTSLPNEFLNLSLLLKKHDRIGIKQKLMQKLRCSCLCAGETAQ